MGVKTHALFVLWRGGVTYGEDILTGLIFVEMERGFGASVFVLISGGGAGVATFSYAGGGGGVEAFGGGVGAFGGGSSFLTSGGGTGGFSSLTGEGAESLVGLRTSSEILFSSSGGSTAVRERGLLSEARLSDRLRDSGLESDVPKEVCSVETLTGSLMNLLEGEVELSEVGDGVDMGDGLDMDDRE